jgi:pyruvate formate lyase activating enzyme
MNIQFSRRHFLQVSSAGTLGLGLGATALPNMLLAQQDPAAGPGLDELEFQEPADELAAQEAMFYEPLAEQRIQCKLCPWECAVADQERGTCGVRENRGGKYYTLVHSHPCAAHIDPIEKKPLFHYLPGSQAFSIATAGCNLECKFCQNWDIAQVRPEQVETMYLPPAGVTEIALKYQCPTIAYTYSEPVIFYEYVYDSAAYARQNKIGSVIISNGFIQKEPLLKLCAQLTAVKIDLKGFTEKFYQETCRGKLQPVLQTLEILRDVGIWYEIVVLILPTLNDSRSELEAMTQWIVKELGAHVPVHFSRFHPMYKLANLPPTPVKTVEMARDIALQAGLQFVYIGNIPGHPSENTYCPNCRQIAVKRIGFKILAVNLDVQGNCTNCQTHLPGIWNPAMLETA